MVIIYIDDILIYTKMEAAHDEITKEVLQWVRENDLYIKPEKCFWKVREVEFLGVILGPDGIKMDPTKLDAVKHWPTPLNMKDIQQFIRFANYYRRFIKDFTKVARPLHDLVGINKEWKWEEKQQVVFNTLKKLFTEQPLLAAPDTDKKFQIESDASDYTTGGVLSMLCNDEKWRPVAYLSKSLNPAERNYDVHDKEMLGIMRCLEAWHHYLEGAKQQFEIWMDHKNLEYFMNVKKLNRQQARWALYLSQFNFVLSHKPGAMMVKADSLSRRPDHKKGMEDDNKDVVLLKPEFFCIQALRRGHLLIHRDEKGLLKKIRESKVQDEQVVKAVEAMKNQE